MSLNSPMGNAVQGNGGATGEGHRGSDMGIYNHHVVDVVSKPADIGPGDIHLKFFDLLDGHKPVEVSSPSTGTTIKMGK